MSPSLCDQLERVPLAAVLVVLAGIVYLGNFLEEGTNTWFEVRRFDKATDEGGKGKGQHCVYILFLRNVLQRTIIEQLEWSERAFYSHSFKFFGVAVQVEYIFILSTTAPY